MKALLVCLFVWVATFAAAAPMPAKDVDPVKFAAKAWALVRKEGPAAVNKLKDWPEAFRNVGNQVAAFKKRVAERAAPMERLRLLSQLWRLRGTINLLALLTPQNLAAITGLDPDTLQSLGTTLNRAQKALGR